MQKLKIPQNTELLTLLSTNTKLQDIQTIEDVIAIMDGIDKALPQEDGLKAFNFLYRMVTKAVLECYQKQQLKSPEWLFHLDVEFGKIYFQNVRQCLEDPIHAPRCWMLLLKNRLRKGPVKVQFATVGICSHIVRDLMLAIMKAYEITGLEPRKNSPEWDDYLFINDILDEVELKAMEELASGMIRSMNRWFKKSHFELDRKIAMSIIRRARYNAFERGLYCCRIKNNPQKLEEFTQKWDRAAARRVRLLLFSPHFF